MGRAAAGPAAIPPLAVIAAAGLAATLASPATKEAALLVIVYLVAAL
jgi:hypothetical protein